MPRLSFEQSCRVLQERQLIPSAHFSGSGEEASRYDDEAGRIIFARTEVAEAKMEHLTMPRTFFGRSEIRQSSFKDTDLSESTAHWNDFINVNFTSADLSNSDFRACVFKRVRFKDAKLAGVDFRYCGFSACDFSGADMTEVKLTVKAGKALRLSDEQQSVIDWQADDGAEPEGG